MPSVSVVMAVHNGARFLREAIDSVLGQSFADFELLVVDDASTDDTPSILAALADARVRVIRNPRNRGQTESLNIGLAEARGTYVARLDADDVAEPQRFARQLAYLDAHPEVGLLGSTCTLVDETGRALGIYRVPRAHLLIQWLSHLANPFVHPSVMLRRRLLLDTGAQYDPRFKTQDYELWTRLLPRTRAANLKEPLVRYRIHAGSMTSIDRGTQLLEQDRIALRTIRERLPEVAIEDEQITPLRRLFVRGSENVEVPTAERASLAELYVKMLRAFLHRNRSEPQALRLRCRETLKLAYLAAVPPTPATIPMLRRATALWSSHR